MSGDEVLVLIASAVVAALGWGRWYLNLLLVRSMLCGPRLRWALAALPLACAAILLTVLRCWAADDVRHDLRYLLMYEVLGMAWIWLAGAFAPLLGYSVRDDALERRNRAAAWAVGGLLIGLTLCFAGGNVGNGPGWWVVAFAACLATAGLYVVWAILEWDARPREAVTMDRDVAAGIRLAGFLTACGLILGRAVAGDWVSAAATLRDFARLSWPLVVLLGVTVLTERLMKTLGRGDDGGLILRGAAPALVYLAGALAWLYLCGKPN